jgi:hypothetical protein
MSRRELLVRISTVQLAAGIAGNLVAIRRRRNYDVGFLRGRPGTVVRDSFLLGTAYSAPVSMLAVQAWATRNLARGPDDGARRMLGVLGVVMVPGYLLERFGRAHLTPTGFDPVETPVVAVGLLGAAAMGVLGHRAQSGR